MSVRVVVADDQTVVRDGLVTLLKLLPGIDVVAAASDGAEAVRMVAEHNPDVLLVDLRMPNVDGVEATRQVRTEYPRTEVVVLTTYSDDDSVLSALRAGARGYITKDADAESIGRAIEAAAAGQSILDADVQRRLIEGAATAPKPVDTGLTPRELDVLRLIAEGLSNTEIARQLFVSEATVKTHINHLFAKANLRDRAQAVAYAYRLGLA
jgi:DNA-binding NarL/FixJ family response regulator